MAYDDFLMEFARVQGVGSVQTLLSEHAERYNFQIKSRERAAKMIDTLKQAFEIDFNGLRILDVGCAYGSFAIEMAKQGSHVVGIDISDKWLKLAELNARGEVDIKFLNSDASSYTAAQRLKEDGPFDLFIVNDVFEHIYDTVGLVNNLSQLGAPQAKIYFKIPNGQATRHVLMEGHKKVFGISLLAPDYWSEFVSAPFHIYYRRWSYFKAIFDLFGFRKIDLLNNVTDASVEVTRKFITNDINRISAQLKPQNFKTPKQYNFLKGAADYYYDEVGEDLEKLGWDDLFRKYRVTFWEGLAIRDDAAVQ